VPPVPDGPPVEPAEPPGRAGTATGPPSTATGIQVVGDGQSAVRVAAHRHTLRVLTTSQVLGGVAVSSGIVVGGLLAADLAGSQAYAGVAQTCATLGAALLAVPVSRLMARRGRRPGLAVAYSLAAAGAVLAVLAGARGSVGLLLVAMLAFGAGQTANLQARYAATDLATDRTRGRSLATVVWATTVGAVLGPNLADPGGRLASAVGLPPLAGSFLFSIASFGLAVAVVTMLLRPDPLLTARRLSAARDAGPPQASLRQSMRVVAGSPGARLGLLAVATAHAVMVGVMVMTPVHMGHDGATLRVIGLVISVHILGMYAFSPLVGWLVDRYGRRRVILVGAVLQLAATLVAGTAAHGSTSQASMAHGAAAHGSMAQGAAVSLGAGLFLLGLGWSCGLVAGSTLLTESVPVPSRPAVQGAADLVVGLAAGVGGVVAGVVVARLGYPALNAVAAAAVVPVLVALGRQARS
jgi:MFS family permease